MRVLLDTNVLIAAFVSRGRCAELLEYCAEAHDLITSEELLDEYRDKLVRRFRLTPELAVERTSALRSIMQIVSAEPLPTPVCRDPDDDLVLATGLAGACACIVTGDKDLLVLREFEGMTIIAPREFESFEKET